MTTNSELPGRIKIRLGGDKQLKNFKRGDLSFSLCGLNCALCTMRLDGHCPGCGGGEGNQGCPIARCSMERGGYEYCSACENYPCPKYEGITQFDSFITHRNQITDMAEMARLGCDAYHLALEQKSQILKYLLAEFNDGRKKTFFCLAVNLLNLPDIQAVAAQIKERITAEMTVKERAAAAVECLDAAAKDKGIVLKLNKKPSKAK